MHDNNFSKNLVFNSMIPARNNSNYFDESGIDCFHWYRAVKNEMKSSNVILCTHGVRINYCHQAHKYRLVLTQLNDDRFFEIDSASMSSRHKIYMQNYFANVKHLSVLKCSAFRYILNFTHFSFSMFSLFFPIKSIYVVWKWNCKHDEVGSECIRLTSWRMKYGFGWQHCGSASILRKFITYETSPTVWKEKKRWRKYE